MFSASVVPLSQAMHGVDHIMVPTCMRTTKKPTSAYKMAGTTQSKEQLEGLVVVDDEH
jgi:hypothetical protein